MVYASLSETQAAQLLGLSPDVLHERIRAGEFITFASGGRDWLPSWQFDTEQATRSVAGLRELGHAFPGDGLSLSYWMLRSNVDLDDEFPIVLMRKGEWKRVVAAVPPAPGE